MPWVLEMNFTPEQAEALRLGGIKAGKVEWWYLKQKAALDFPTDWLPKYGRVAVRLTIEEDGKAPDIREIPPALPDPIPNYDKTPEEFAKPVVAGVVEARLYRTTRKPAFLPIIDLAGQRHEVERYLQGCSQGEIKRWLEGVGDLHYVCETVLPEGVKYRFVSRSGYETTVDLGPETGLHIVY